MRLWSVRSWYSIDVGYDAAVCVQRYEPWIIETYNTSIASPSAPQVVGKGNVSTPLVPSGRTRGRKITNTRYLNTTGKDDVFGAAHPNTVEQMQKDYARDGRYLPSPTVGSIVPSRTTLLLTLGCCEASDGWRPHMLPFRSPLFPPPLPLGSARFPRPQPYTSERSY